MSIDSMNPFDLISENLTTTSLKVAEVYSVPHEELVNFIETELNAEIGAKDKSIIWPVSYADAKNRDKKVYEMTKEGFIFLVDSIAAHKTIIN